jgi:competence protein ComFC
MTSPKKILLDLLFPKKCVCCHKWGSFVCSNCYQKITFKKTQDCPGCNAITDKGRYCTRCRSKHALLGVTTLGYYKDPILKALIQELKYKGIYAISEDMAHWLALLIKKEKLCFDLIAYVPMTQKRKGRRGYNQSEEVAKHLSKEAGIPLFKGLKKVRETKTQVGLSKKDRLKNLQDAFVVKKNSALLGKRIILIDDVITTGTTLNECARTLEAAGAKRVWGLTIAKE